MRTLIAAAVAIAIFLVGHLPLDAQIHDVQGDGSRAIGRTVQKVVTYDTSGNLLTCALTISSVHTDHSTYWVTWHAAQGGNIGDTAVFDCRWTTLMTCADQQHFLSSDGLVEGWECSTSPYGSCVRVYDFIPEFGRPAFRHLDALPNASCRAQL